MRTPIPTESMLGGDESNLWSVKPRTPAGPVLLFAVLLLAFASINILLAQPAMRVTTARTFNSNANRLLKSDSSVLVATSRSNPLARSVDGGLTWTLFSVPTNDCREEFDLSVTGQGVIVAATHAGRFFRSVDNGESWQNLSVPFDSAHRLVPLSGRGRYLVAYRNSRALFDNSELLTESIYISEDFGTTWQSIVSEGVGSCLAADLNGDRLAIASFRAIHIFDRRIGEWRHFPSREFPINATSLVLHNDSTLSVFRLGGYEIRRGATLAPAPGIVGVSFLTPIGGDTERVYFTSRFGPSFRGILVIALVLASGEIDTIFAGTTSPVGYDALSSAPIIHGNKWLYLDSKRAVVRVVNRDSASLVGRVPNSEPQAAYGGEWQQPLIVPAIYAIGSVWVFCNRSGQVSSSADSGCTWSTINQSINPGPAGPARLLLARPIASGRDTALRLFFDTRVVDFLPTRREFRTVEQEIPGRLFRYAQIGDSTLVRQTIEYSGLKAQQSFLEISRNGGRTYESPWQLLDTNLHLAAAIEIPQKAFVTFFVLSPREFRYQDGQVEYIERGMAIHYSSAYGLAPDSIVTEGRLSNVSGESGGDRQNSYAVLALARRSGMQMDFTHDNLLVSWDHRSGAQSQQSLPESLGPRLLAFSPNRRVGLVTSGLDGLSDTIVATFNAGATWESIPSESIGELYGRCLFDSDSTLLFVSSNVHRYGVARVTGMGPNSVQFSNPPSTSARVYPNPAHGEARLRFASPSLLRKAVLIDIHGRSHWLRLEAVGDPNGSEYRLDLPFGYAAGMYRLHLTFDTHSETVSILVTDPK